MQNINKRPAIHIPNTNPNPVKQNCPTAEPPPLESQLSQIQSALSAATTLLATLANLAMTLVISNHATTPSTTPALTPTMTPSMIPETTPESTPATNPAMILAMPPALPAALLTTPEPMVGVLGNLEIASTILLSVPPTLYDHGITPFTNSSMIPATTPAMNPLTIPETSPATNPAMILATPALPVALATTPERVVGVLANLEIAPRIPLCVPPTLYDHGITPFTNPSTIPATTPAMNPSTIQRQIQQ
jgi:hypothetical protein